MISVFLFRDSRSFPLLVFFTFLKEKYHDCLCFSYFEHAVSIFVKFGGKVMPLEAVIIKWRERH